MIMIHHGKNIYNTEMVGFLLCIKDCKIYASDDGISESS